MADFEWYRSFVAIYRLGSISAAAHQRHMTQPALSQHLASLEANIGELLFRRTPRQMVPTERGNILYSQVAQAVDQLEKITNRMGKGEIPPSVRIGGPAEFIQEWLVNKLPPSGYQLSFTLGHTKPLLKRLVEGELDLLIATQQVASSGLVYRRLATETFLLVGQQPLSLSEDIAVLQQQLEQQTWISYAPDHPIIRRFWFEAFGVRNNLQSALIVPDLRIIKTMVAQGLGISVLPDYLVAADVQNGTLHQLWQPAQAVQNDLWLVYRSSDRIDQSLMAFVEQLLSDVPTPDEPR